MNAERLQELAKAIYKADPCTMALYRTSAWEIAWEELNNDWKRPYLDKARAACKHLGFVDAKGEVVVPERGAVMDVVRRIENFRLAMADHRARLPIDVRLEFDACLLDFRASWSALQGGDDG